MGLDRAHVEFQKLSFLVPPGGQGVFLELGGQGGFLELGGQGGF